VLALKYRPWKFKRQNFTVKSQGVEGVIGRMSLTVMFPLECLDPPAASGPPPQWGNYQLQGFSPISLKNLALRQTKKRCKSILVRALSYSASPI